MASRFAGLSSSIRQGIWDHGTLQHPTFGKIFAYEVDGFGGVITMDDANLPSLLSMPDMGFCDSDNEIYKSTRNKIFSKSGNPYYLSGRYFNGVGSPHTGIRNAWPMSLLVRIRTTDDDNEISSALDAIKNSTNSLGLIHESLHVDIPPEWNGAYSRPWFAWANAAKTILDLAYRKPELIFQHGHDSPFKLSDLH